MPSAIIIAGPNGAGKTTFAREYLWEEELRYEFVNADEIARAAALDSGFHSTTDLRAGRIMLELTAELIDAGISFALETTLASLTYAQKIPHWRRRGYHVSLIYLRLNSVEESLARVRKRVEVGGHDIPPDVIQRRFTKSAAYFENIYKTLVDEWQIWESREGTFLLINSLRKA